MDEVEIVRNIENAGFVAEAAQHALRDPRRSDLPRARRAAHAGTGRRARRRRHQPRAARSADYAARSARGEAAARAPIARGNDACVYPRALGAAHATGRRIRGRRGSRSTNGRIDRPSAASTSRRPTRPAAGDRPRRRRHPARPGQRPHASRAVAGCAARCRRRHRCRAWVGDADGACAAPVRPRTRGRGRRSRRAIARGARRGHGAGRRHQRTRSRRYEPLADSALSAAVFHELLGFSVAGPGGGRGRRASGGSHDADADRVARVRRSSPHAPYSVSPALLAAIARAARRRRRSASTSASRAEEIEFLRDGTGAWRELLETLGVWNPRGRCPACGPVDVSRSRSGCLHDRPARRARRAADRRRAGAARARPARRS